MCIYTFGNDKICQQNEFINQTEISQTENQT